MALTVPTEDALLRHMHRTEDEEFTDDESDWAADVLQQATDMMAMAAPLTDDPTDELTLRVVTLGILAMSYALWVRTGDREAMYAPFQSERIGSYSYSKAQIAQAAASGLPTGIAEFDIAVQRVRDENSTDWHHKEDVFVQDLAVSEAELNLESRDLVLHPDAFGR